MFTIGDGVDNPRDGSANGHALYFVVALLVVVENANGGHSKGRKCVDPGPAYKPYGQHTVHTEEPITDEYPPTAHGLHAEAPTGE